MIKTFKPRPVFSRPEAAGSAPTTLPNWRQLRQLNDANQCQRHSPGWRLHLSWWRGLSGWSVLRHGNWRITFAFAGEDAILVAPGLSPSLKA